MASRQIVRADGDYHAIGAELNPPTDPARSGLTTDGDLTIRLMRDERPDHELMLKWLSDPQVLMFTYGRDRSFTLEEIRAKYGPRIRGESPTVPCFIEIEGSAIGYTQFYRWIDWIDDAHTLGLDPDDLAFGLDIWIGEPGLWNRSLGTRAVKAMLRFMFDRRGATSVTLSTVTWNQRAIRCYEKAGFTKVRLLKGSERREGTLHDEWVMVARRPGTETGPLAS
jgi:aminoglycoside 6'-N-acetyltransferase